MLQNLHVKNLALIDETEVDFGPGLNILTGETGAGKSILLGSVGLALGAKYSADMLRNGTDSGLVELTFTVDDEKLKKRLEALDIFPEGLGLEPVSLKAHAAGGHENAVQNGESETGEKPENKSVEEGPSVLSETQSGEEKMEAKPSEKQVEKTRTVYNNKVMKVVFWSVLGAAAAVALLLGAFVLLSHLCPDFIDSLLYSKEELELINR